MSVVGGHLLEIAIFMAVVVADAYGLVPLTQTIVLVPLVWVALRVRKESWQTIGFSWPSHPARSIAIGLIAGLVLELFATSVTTPQISAFFGAEICFRGFLLKRLAQVFGESRAAWWVGLTLSSLLFGWGHTEQGMSGWVQEGLSGFLLGALVLAFGRNLTLPIVAHGVSNTLAFVLIYFGRYPGLPGA